MGNAALDSLSSPEGPLYGLILRFNRRYLRVSQRLPSPLPINESHVLAEIAQRDGVTAKEIGLRIGIPKSTLSRVISSFEQRGYVNTYPARFDKRWRELNLTALGAVVLSEDTQRRNLQTQAAAAPLTPDERGRFRDYHRRIAENLSTPPVNPSAEEDALEQVLRRLTRGFGFLGVNCLGTQLPPEECHILYITGSANSPVPLALLSNEYPIDLSALSRLVSSLAAAKILAKSRPGSDKRRVELVITPRGERLHRRTLEAGNKFILSFLRGFSAAEVNDFVDLHTRLHSSPANLDELVAPPAARVEIVSSEAQRRQGRAFLIERLVRNAQHFNLPEAILPASSTCALLRQAGGLIIGLCEIEHTTEGWRLSHLFDDSRLDDGSGTALLLSGALGALFGAQASANVLVPDRQPVHEILCSGRPEGLDLCLTKQDYLQACEKLLRCHVQQKQK